MLNGQAISAVKHLDPMQMTQLLGLLRQGRLLIAQEIIYLKAQEKRNQGSLREYLKQLTQHYAKLLFIRIDLSIELKYQHQVDIEQFPCISTYLYQSNAESRYLFQRPTWLCMGFRARGNQGLSLSCLIDLRWA